MTPKVIGGKEYASVKDFKKAKERPMHVHLGETTYFLKTEHDLRWTDKNEAEIDSAFFCLSETPDFKESEVIQNKSDISPDDDFFDDGIFRGTVHCLLDHFEKAQDEVSRNDIREYMYSEQFAADIASYQSDEQTLIAQAKKHEQRTEEFHGTYTQFQAGDREFTVNTIRRFDRGADEWLNPTVNIYDSKNNENLFVEVESEEKGLETVRDIEKSFENKSDVSLSDVKKHLDEQGLKTNMERQEQQQQTQQPANGQDIALARKAGYVQGVCECALVVSEDKMLTKKLLSEMGITRDMAQKFAKPETFKEMEQSVYARKNERSLKHKNHIKL